MFYKLSIKLALYSYYNNAFLILNFLRLFPKKFLLLIF
jgi:hypothetical protein